MTVLDVVFSQPALTAERGDTPALLASTFENIPA
jgi:hypothetical protein